MEYRELGNTGQELSAIGFGCMGLSHAYGKADDAESLRTLDHALASGVNFWDTADVYGHNEDLICKALQGRRSEVFLATKFALNAVGSSTNISVQGSPEYVKAACEKSLKRLGIETIDLYYQHRVDPDTPIEDTVGAMAELVKEGKVRYLGLSEASAETIRRACAIYPIAALQSEYSLWTRDPEGEILSVCRELGVGFVPFSPLGRGFLSGQFSTPEDFEEGDLRRFNPRFQGGNFYKNLELVEEVKKIAQYKGCTPSQLALAWLLAQGKDIIPIPGTRKIANFDENIGALNVSLSVEEINALRDFLPPVAGERYAPAALKMVNK